ncbi:MAG TPA: TonB-dependent receptor [Bacteroidota bacterium]|nr:TonB-dependent receptor [Bacteroidota bacterium]
MLSRISILAPSSIGRGDFHFSASPQGSIIHTFMILRFFIFLFCICITTATAAAQATRVADDTLLFALDYDITVSATRLPVQLQYAPAATEVLRAHELRTLPAGTLADVLMLSGGTAVRDYGGPGGLQLASLRGLGAEYTVVLLDGVRMNDAQNAIVDVGRIPLDMADRVEIARGGFASLYGSNALGGIINILPRQDLTAPEIAFGVGAFGWMRGRVAIGTQGRLGRAFVDAAYEEADNDYSFTPRWGSADLTRQNASYLRRRLRAGGTLALRSGTLALYADALASRVGVPGPLFSESQGRATQDDDELHTQLRHSTALFGGTLGSSVSLRATRQRYRDPLLVTNGVALDSRYDNAQGTVALGWDRAFDGGSRLLAGVELGETRLWSEELRDDPRRKQAALFVSADVPLHLAGLRLHVFPSLRYDHLADAGTERRWGEMSPSLGAHAELLPDVLALRARVSRSFVAPTFNQLYWLEGGNADLRPEYSIAWDAGVRVQPGAAMQTVEVTAFYHDITDKIVWMPGAGLWWTPRNVQHVRARGLEVSATASLGRVATLRVQGNWISSIKENASFPGDRTQGKQLIYIPRISAACIATVSLLPNLTASWTQRFVGARYYTESNDASLPAHTLADMALSWDVALWSTALRLKAEVLNVFDTSYEVVAFYPTPGRNARGTCSIMF